MEKTRHMRTEHARLEMRGVGVILNLILKQDLFEEMALRRPEECEGEPCEYLEEEKSASTEVPMQEYAWPVDKAAKRAE